MSDIYVPVFKLAVSYSVNVGRRWSIIEHLLLSEVATRRRSIAALAEDANLPRRLVVEAMINLLRAGWVEVRATTDGTVFRATKAGEKRSGEEELPAQLHRDVRWISLCVERLTGAWFRSEDLDLVYANDLPDNAHTMVEKIDSIDPRDLPRDLLYLRPDEALEPVEPLLRTPSRPYARVRVDADGVAGLPGYAPLDLVEQVKSEEKNVSGGSSATFDINGEIFSAGSDDFLEEDALIVGGEAHLRALETILQTARSTVIIHSCFINPEAIEKLVPAFEKAATRGIRIELLWGLYNDPESGERQRSVVESDRVLATTLSENGRSRVKLSSVSSRSHSKLIIYDEPADGTWRMVLGSCNFLSSWFNLIEVSVRVANASIIANTLGRLIGTQQPASGAWPPMTVRLSRAWGKIRATSGGSGTEATHALRLVADREHYTCVTRMRDEAIRLGAGTHVDLGCDLYGSAADSSVLTPLGRAAELGVVVRVNYRRPSKYLVSEGLKPDAADAQRRGIALETVGDLHGKYVIVGEDVVIISSFNWLSTSVEGARTRSAELGLWVRGAGIGALLRERLRVAGVPSPEPSAVETLELFRD
jgi:hypothetical protein